MNTQDPNPFHLKQKPQTSGWSVVSLVTSLLAPVFSCLCVPTLILSILAIFSGHKARGQIANSNGTTVGIGKATTGLALGYIFLVLSVLGIPSFITGMKGAIDRRNNPDAFHSGPADALRDAERLVSSDSHGLANGNTPRAEELAREFNATMKEIREDFFSEAEGMDLTEGRFVTYCELHDDSCAFISQAPLLRKFEDEAKDQLGNIAWTIAREITLNDLEPTDQLAVALRGRLLYGQVRIGNHRDEVRPNDMKDKDDRLAAFFPTAEADVVAPADLEDLAEELELDITVEEPAGQ